MYARPATRPLALILLLVLYMALLGRYTTRTMGSTRSTTSTILIWECYGMLHIRRVRFVLRYDVIRTHIGAMYWRCLSFVM